MRGSELARSVFGRGVRETLGAFGAIAAVAVLATAIAGSGGPGAGGGGLVGTPAPDFVASDIAGASVRLAELRGRPVWIEFFSSWCTNCREEDPDIEALYRQRIGAGSDLAIVGVGVGESVSSAATYAGNAGLSFPILADPQWSAARRYAVVATPTHVFVDRDGVIRAVRVGGLRPETMRTLIATIAGGG